MQRAVTFEDVMTKPRQDYVWSKQNTLLKTVDQNWWMMPKNIKVDDILNFTPKSMKVTIKYDGVRRFLLVDSNGIFMFDMVGNVSKIGGSIEGASSIIDGEYMQEHNTLF